MRIKEAAKRTGLTEKTIRYYEECGLVVPHKELRYDRLWRDYSEEHIRLLGAVAALRRSSFRVEEIALLLSEPERIPETVENVRERAEITRREAEKLCTLLARPELPISSIASSVGFVSPAHFSQIFKKYTGTSPSDYRKEYFDSLKQETED